MDIGEWDIPPIEKIHEAFSAIVDERITILDSYAKVTSSDRKKEYTIEWNEDIYSSNDNASFWQGYMGYPVIAVLMLQGKITFDQDVATNFKGINWKELNKKCKNNYAKAVGIIMGELEQKGVDTQRIIDEVNNIYTQIKNINVKRRQSTIRPPV